MINWLIDHKEMAFNQSNKTTISKHWNEGTGSMKIIEHVVMCKDSTATHPITTRAVQTSWSVKQCKQLTENEEINNCQKKNHYNEWETTSRCCFVLCLPNKMRVQEQIKYGSEFVSLLYCEPPQARRQLPDMCAVLVPAIRTCTFMKLLQYQWYVHVIHYKSIGGSSLFGVTAVSFFKE